MKANYSRKENAIDAVQSVIDEAFRLYHLVSLGGESHLLDMDYNEISRSLLPLRLTLEGAGECMQQVLDKGGINKQSVADSIREKAMEAGAQREEICEWLKHWDYKIRTGMYESNAQTPLAQLEYNRRIVDLLCAKIQAVYEATLDQVDNHKSGVEL